MKFVSFTVDARASYGTLHDDAVYEPDDEFRWRFPDLRSVIAAGELDTLARQKNARQYPVAEIDFLPLIPVPDKLLCVGVNFRPHIEEMGRDVPDHPVVFVRFPGSQTGHDQPVVRPAVSEQFDFEGELAIVIGRAAHRVARSDALQHVAGYCCFMDGSVRDWQRHTSQFTAGKNFLKSGAMGPVLVTADEITDPARLLLTTRVNGAVMQQGAIADLLFDIPTLIEYCSTFAQLLPGDVIATGTPGGVGAARTPPIWLSSGDVVEVDIPGVGLLRNPVVNE